MKNELQHTDEVAQHPIFSSVLVTTENPGDSQSLPAESSRQVNMEQSMSASAEPTPNTANTAAQSSATAEFELLPHRGVEMYGPDSSPPPPPPAQTMQVKQKYSALWFGEML